MSGTDLITRSPARDGSQKVTWPPSLVRAEIRRSAGPLFLITR